jgi:uroporphyrinogen-III synthase
VRLIVTRPAAQAAAWVSALQSRCCDAQALPLIDIAPPDDPQAVQQAWLDLAATSLVMFVSANAVQHFFALKPAAAAWPAATRAAATGPGTAAALRRAGIPPAGLVEPAADAPSFDSEALWARLSPEDWSGRRVLVVRGQDGRDWLADTLGQRGAQVGFVAAYQRRAPALTAAGLALLTQALAQPAEHLWLFSSSEAVRHLAAFLPTTAWTGSLALATHPRIVAAVREQGCATVALVAPDIASVAQALQAWPSIQSRASNAP